jgi:hypothetical protein
MYVASPREHQAVAVLWPRMVVFCVTFVPLKFICEAAY